MVAHVAKVTFTRGEATPLIHARRDIEIYQAAAAKIRNWFILKEGGVRRRSGTRYRGTFKYTDKDTRLVDFIFSKAQSYALELGHQYVRFWAAGGQIADPIIPADPYEIAAPYDEADLRSLMWASSFDTTYFAHASQTKKVKKLKRMAHDDWAWSDVDFIDGPYLPINDTSNSVTPSDIPYAGTTRTFTHSSLLHINDGAGFVSTDVGRHYRIQLEGRWAWGKITVVTSSTVINVLIEDSGFTDAATGVTNWDRASNYTSVYFQPGNEMVVFPASGTHTVTSADIGKVGKFALDVGIVFFAEIKGIGASGAVRVILQSAVATVTTKSKTWRLGAFSDTTGYPGGVSWFNGRLCWSRTDGNPRGVFYSRSNLPESMSPSDFDGTVTDNHGGAFDILGGGDEILWIHDGPRLQIGTAGAIRTLGASNSDQSFGPRNVSQRRETEGGVSDVRPVSVGGSTVHVNDFGQNLHDLTYDGASGSLQAPELSIISNHLFDAGVKEIVYQRHPNSLLWAVLNDGKLTSTTIERNEKVAGFAQHDLAGGEVVSACSIPGISQHDLYLGVRRTINGSQVQYMETLDPQFQRKSKSLAFFVDCGGTYSGSPANTVTGITWLEGVEVDVLADGAVMPRQTVTGGTITLPGDRLCSTISFGIPIDDECELLPPPINTPEGSSIGRRMRVVGCTASVYETQGLKFVSDRGQIDVLAFRPPGTPMGEAPPLITGDKKLPIDGSWASDGVIGFHVRAPLPGTVLALNIGLDYEP